MTALPDGQTDRALELATSELVWRSQYMSVRPTRARSWIAASAALMVVVCASVAAPAETASVPALKAAFIYNFAKFAEWQPAVLPDGAPLVLCVADDSKVARALEEATAGRDTAGHSLLVRRVELEGPVRSCHLLYAGGLDERSAAQLVETLKGASVLSVSDFGTFAQLGGSAHLFVEDGRMRFAVNLDAVSRTGVRLSSRLLSLALIVKDDTNVSRR